MDSAVEYADIFVYAVDLLVLSVIADSCKIIVALCLVDDLTVRCIDPKVLEVINKGECLIADSCYALGKYNCGDIAVVFESLASDSCNSTGNSE